MFRRLANQAGGAILAQMRTFETRPPTAQEMEQMAFDSVASLPAQFRDKLAGVAVRVEEFATREQLESVELRSKWELTGLYDGRPVSEESAWDSGELPAMIFLFRQPLVREWRETGVTMRDLVHHVVVHEAGHHFGYSDEDMHALEDEAEDERWYQSQRPGSGPRRSSAALMCSNTGPYRAFSNCTPTILRSHHRTVAMTGPIVSMRRLI